MALTFLVGGARSGKSRLAVELGRRHEAGGGSVVYVATSAVVDDDNWGDRVRRHRDERPSWPTIEEPVDLIAALGRAADSTLVIVDCLTLWVSNLMWRGDSADEIVPLAEAVTAAAQQRPAPTVVVSNEVGLGIHPDTQLGRDYRDVLGAVNQRFGAAADRSLFLVAGRALPLTDPFELLNQSR